MIEIDDIIGEIDDGDWNLMLLERVQDPENAELTIIDIKCRMAEKIKADMDEAIRKHIDTMGAPKLNLAKPSLQQKIDALEKLLNAQGWAFVHRSGAISLVQKTRDECRYKDLDKTDHCQNGACAFGCNVWEGRA